MADEAQAQPATEPTTAPASSETAHPEITLTPEAPQTESAPEALSGAVEAPRASENSEAVTDTTTEPPASVPDSGEARQTAQTVPAHTSSTVNHPHGDLAIARAKIQETKRKKLDKIMIKLAEKGKITNDEVEKLLHVSDATATRYLQVLEKENRIKQVGVTGTGVWYEKI